MNFFLKQREHVALALLIAALVIVHSYWIFNDHGTLAIQDGYIYLTNLLQFLDGPTPSSPQEFWAALKKLSNGGRPPLYSLLTIPSILLFGRSVAAACTVNLIFVPILLFCTYRLAKSISGVSGGLLAAFLVGTFPPIVHLTRNYMPYSVLPACGILSLWLLAELLRHRSIKTAWYFGASIGLGMMIHPQFSRFAVPTTLVSCCYIWLFPQEGEARESSDPMGWRVLSWLKGRLTDPLFLKGLVPAAFIACMLVLPWYLTAGFRLFALARKVDSGFLEQFRGHAVETIGFETTEPAFWFLKTAPGTISWVFALFAMVGVVYGVLKRQPVPWLLVFSLVSTYAIFDRLTTRAWWGFAVALPVAAVLIGLWIANVRPKWLSSTLIAVCLVVGSFNFSLVTWGVHPSLLPMAAFLGAPLEERTCGQRAALPLCPAPARPAREKLPEFEVVKLILEDPECRKRTCQLLKLRGAISWIRLQYHVVAQYPGSKLRVVRANSPSFGRPYGLESLLKSDYLLYPEGEVEESKNFYTSTTLNFLSSPPPAFSEAHRKIRTYGKRRGQTLVLVKRVAPLTVREAEATLAALGLEEQYLGEKFRLLSPLYQAEADVEGMERLYEDAVARKAGKGLKRILRIALKNTRKKAMQRELKGERRSASPIVDEIGMGGDPPL